MRFSLKNRGKYPNIHKNLSEIAECEIIYNNAKEVDDLETQYQILNKLSKKYGIKVFELDEVITYAHLLGLKGLHSRAMDVLKTYEHESHDRCNFHIMKALLPLYLYLDDYIHAEGIILDYFCNNEYRKENFSFKDLYSLKNRNIRMAVYEIARNNNYVFSNVNIGNISFYERQMIDYSIELTKFYTLKYFTDKKTSYSHFAPGITFDGLIDTLKPRIDNLVKSTNSDVVDRYYFDFNKVIGYNKDQQELSGVEVTTLKNSSDIIDIQPVRVNKNNSMFFYYNVAMEEKEEQPKVFSKSQIDRFKKRYNMQ